MTMSQGNGLDHARASKDMRADVHASNDYTYHRPYLIDTYCKSTISIRTP